MDFNKATYLPGGIAGLLGFISAAATIVSKKLTKKNQNVKKKTVSLAEADSSQRLCKTSRYQMLNSLWYWMKLSNIIHWKKGLRKNNSRIFLEKADDATLREEIKKRVSEEIKLSAYTRKELRIQVEGKSNGFSLFIPRHKY